MCGIVGFTGTEQAAPILLGGLSRLEYRGYDSAGMAVLNDHTQKIDIVKAKGRLKILAEKNRRRQSHARLLRHRPYPLGHPRGAKRD